MFWTDFEKLHNLHKSVFKMSDKSYISMHTSTREDFTKFCSCEHFKTSGKLRYQAFLCVCG
jgi:hypothetical protein